jgi:hypothetical protein
MIIGLVIKKYPNNFNLEISEFIVIVKNLMSKKMSKNRYTNILNTQHPILFIIV